MFTGIITHQGKVISNDKNRIVISNPIATKLQKGDSISVNGICLTVTETNEDSFSVDFINETKAKTNIGDLRSGNHVNLELSATPSTLLSGHIVQGHIDTTAEVKEIIKEANQKTFILALKDNLARYIVNKGSVTINGVSLTVINMLDKEFSVGIIPHTYNSTTFKKLNVGDIVNIEVDVLSKYVEKLMKGKNG